MARVTVNEQCDLMTKATALLWATLVIFFGHKLLFPVSLPKSQPE